MNAMNAMHQLNQQAFSRSWVLNNLAFLASQDALEVMYVSQWVSQSVSEGTDRDFSDVTLVSDDTNYFT